jgi:hypothetical protein
LYRVCLFEVSSLDVLSDKGADDVVLRRLQSLIDETCKVIEEFPDVRWLTRPQYWQGVLTCSRTRLRGQWSFRWFGWRSGG